MTHLQLSVVGIQAVIMVWSLVACCRLNRRLQHADTLNELLAKLCLMVFVRQNQPVWQAWTGIMGTITVEVSQNRMMPGDDR